MISILEYEQLCKRKEEEFSKIFLARNVRKFKKFNIFVFEHEELEYLISVVQMTFYGMMPAEGLMFVKKSTLERSHLQIAESEIESHIEKLYQTYLEREKKLNEKK